MSWFLFLRGDDPSDQSWFIVWQLQSLDQWFIDANAHWNVWGLFETQVAGPPPAESKKHLCSLISYLLRVMLRKWASLWWLRAVTRFLFSATYGWLHIVLSICCCSLQNIMVRLEQILCRWLDFSLSVPSFYKIRVRDLEKQPDY